VRRFSLKRGDSHSRENNTGTGPALGFIIAQVREILAQAKFFFVSLSFDC